MGLNSDKTSKVFFVLIFAVFLPDLIFFVPQWHRVIQVSSKLWMFLISTPPKTRMATASWRTCREHDGMRPPKFNSNRSIGGELWYFQYFPTWWPSAILNFKNFNIWSRDCHCDPNLLLCIPNFIKIGSRVRLPGAHNCWMFNAPLLGNGRCHGNRIMADISGIWLDATTQVSCKSVHW